MTRSIIKVEFPYSSAISDTIAFTDALRDTGWRQDTEDVFVGDGQTFVRMLFSESVICERIPDLGFEAESTHQLIATENADEIAFFIYPLQSTNRDKPYVNLFSEVVPATDEPGYLHSIDVPLGYVARMELIEYDSQTYIPQHELTLDD